MSELSDIVDKQLSHLSFETDEQFTAFKQQISDNNQSHKPSSKVIKCPNGNDSKHAKPHKESDKSNKNEKQPSKNSDKNDNDNMNNSNSNNGSDGGDGDKNNDDEKKKNDEFNEDKDEEEEEEKEDEEEEDEEHEEYDIISCDQCKLNTNYIKQQSSLIDTLRELLDDKQMISHNIKLKDSNSASYDPPKSCRGQGNVQIARKLTEKIIPNAVKGWSQRIDEVDEKNSNNNPHKTKKHGTNHLFQYMDKTIAMTSCLNQSKSSKMRILHFDFYDKNNADILYCVIEEQDPKLKNSKRYKWKMRGKLFTTTELYNEYQICAKELPKSPRHCQEFVSQLNQRREILRILEGPKLQTIIKNTKWNKIKTFCQHTPHERSTLSLSKAKFQKYYSEFITHKVDDIDLLPILMFNDNNQHWIEYLHIIRIQTAKSTVIDIGISFRYNAKQKTVKVTGIHLDKSNIYVQHKLVAPQHECHCLYNFESNYTDLKIGAFNEDKDKIKQLTNELEKYKILYESLNNQQHNPIPMYLLISSVPNPNPLSFASVPLAVFPNNYRSNIPFHSQTNCTLYGSSILNDNNKINVNERINK